MTELEKLKKYLDDHGYRNSWGHHFSKSPISEAYKMAFGQKIYSSTDEDQNLVDYDGTQEQIIVYDDNGRRSWDVVCHDWSYGGKDGLLELYGDLCTDVIGCLTANDMIRILEYFKAKGSNWEPIDTLSDIEEK